MRFELDAQLVRADLECLRRTIVPGPKTRRSVVERDRARARSEVDNVPRGLPTLAMQRMSVAQDVRLELNRAAFEEKAAVGDAIRERCATCSRRSRMFASHDSPRAKDPTQRGRT